MPPSAPARWRRPIARPQPWSPGPAPAPTCGPMTGISRRRCRTCWPARRFRARATAPSREARGRMSARLLALDCSTEALAVAACDGERQSTRTTAGGALASSRIIALALEALADCAVPVAQLDAVAFGAGPGAFTGLRCACAVAQGLAFALGKPVLAIDSLMIVAEASRARLPRGLRELWVAMDARMHEAYAAQYRLAQDGHWQVTSAPALYTLPALAACWRTAPPHGVAGNALAAFGERLP
ncbi:MAG: tRNA (adenosine(37)-N6)-threonylcarbamoyltransferase complex dimerization subunit type 1 TsaB, partial [Burkholderiaceae bacterium]